MIFEITEQWKISDNDISYFPLISPKLQVLNGFLGFDYEQYLTDQMSVWIILYWSPPKPAIKLVNFTFWGAYFGSKKNFPTFCIFYIYFLFTFIWNFTRAVIPLEMKIKLTP